VIGLDTNLLLRSILDDDREQFLRATKYIAAHCSAAEPGFVNRIVVCELAWTLERSYRISRETIADAMAGLLASVDLTIEDAEEIRGLLPAYRAGTVGFVDLLLARLNLRQGCSATAAFDRKAARIEGFVRVS